LLWEVSLLKYSVKLRPHCAEIWS